MKSSRPVTAVAAQKTAKAPGITKPGRKPVTTKAKHVLQPPEEEEGEESGEDEDSATGSEVNAGCRKNLASSWPLTRVSLQDMLLKNMGVSEWLTCWGVHNARCCVQ